MRVYLAGPMTSSGEPGPNLHDAAIVAGLLLRRGHAVYVPHANWIVDAIRPTPAEMWLSSDLAWLEASDMVFRLSGVSKGADEEVTLAKRLGIPVVSTVRQVMELEEITGGALRASPVSKKNPRTKSPGESHTFGGRGMTPPFRRISQDYNRMRDRQRE